MEKKNETPLKSQWIVNFLLPITTHDITFTTQFFSSSFFHMGGFIPPPPPPPPPLKKKTLPLPIPPINALVSRSYWHFELFNDMSQGAQQDCIQGGGWGGGEGGNPSACLWTSRDLFEANLFVEDNHAITGYFCCRFLISNASFLQFFLLGSF